MKQITLKKCILLGCLFLSTNTGCGSHADVNQPTSENPPPTLPTSEQQEPTNTVATINPFPSAALLHRFPSEATDRDMNKRLRQIQNYLNSQPLDSILEKGRNDEASGMVVFETPSSSIMLYHSCLPKRQDEVPVLVIGIGQGVNSILEHAIAWFDKGEWTVTPYPRLPEEIEKKRNHVFENSPFASARFLKTFQQSGLLAVVLDYGHTRSAQEVQLLKRESDHWKVLWVPPYDKWEPIYNALVEMRDMNRFLVHRQDNMNPENRWEEVWDLQGEEYKLRRN